MDSSEGSDTTNRSMNKFEEDVIIFYKEDNKIPFENHNRRILNQ